MVLLLQRLCSVHNCDQSIYRTAAVPLLCVKATSSKDLRYTLLLLCQRWKNTTETPQQDIVHEGK